MSFALPVAGPHSHSPTQVAALALALLGPLPPQAVLEALAQAARNMPTAHCILNSTAQPAAHPAAHTTAQPAAQPPDVCLSEEEAQQHVSEALWCLRTLNVTQARSYASGLDAVEHDSIRAWAEGAPVRTQNLALVRAVVSNPATTLQILQQPALHALLRGYLQRAIAPGTDKGDQAPEGRGGARVGLDPLAYLVQAPTLLTSSELLPLVQVGLQLTAVETGACRTHCFVLRSSARCRHTKVSSSAREGQHAR